MLAHGISPIDLLVVNLYPFEATVDAGADFDACVENIDIGGPAMIRAASKNFNDVAVVVAVDDYAPVLAELRANAGATTLALRQRLAQKAFARTAVYDAAISNWLAEEIASMRRPSALSGRRWLRFCATARTRTRALPSTGHPSGALALRQRASCRANSFRIITSATPTRPSSWSPNSIPRAPPPSPSSNSSNPCGVAEGESYRGRLQAGASLRSGLCLRRHRRPQPSPRREGGGGDGRGLHRSHHRAGRR